MLIFIFTKVLVNVEIVGTLPKSMTLDIEGHSRIHIFEGENGKPVSIWRNLKDEDRE